ncbi:hypothetical protein [Microcoleus sp. D2_18a_B4]|uniref:hypothetical protein n=1 Tax=Microcoleus sp. D2_18a_B4 TaxID=3055329 RepID=UPI002FD51F47
MPDFFHSALRGDQIHEAKIKVLPEGSIFPAPDWEGQFLVIGLKLYVSIKQNNVLTWTQPKAYNLPQLPSNVVTFEQGYENPPAPRDKSGVIYLNIDTKDIWYFEGANWIKLGQGGSASSLDIISGRSTTNWQGNFFGLLNPVLESEENCLLVKKWLPNTKYYFAITTPAMLSLGGSDDNLFYIGLWDGWGQSHVIASYLDKNDEICFTLDTTLFNEKPEPYRLGIYIKRDMGYWRYLNFEFNLDTRFVKIKELANISYGY